MALAGALPARLPFTSGSGGTYYVDPVNGSDSRTSTQAQVRSTAWRTINFALATVPAAGAIIKVLPGTFQAGDASTAPIGVNGRLFSTSDPVTVMAETPLTVKIQPTQVQNSYGGWLRSTQGIRIQGFVFDPITVPGSQIYQSNVVIYDSDRIEITGCEFHPAGEKGILISGGPYGSGRTTDDVWVIGNTFRPSGTDPYVYVTGVDFPLGTYYGSRGAHFIYCGAFGTNGASWDQTNGARRFVVANNVFVGSTHGRDVEIGPQGRDGFVVNNTFFGNHNIQKIAADNGTPSNLNVDINGFQAAAGQSACGVIQFSNASVQSFKPGNNIVANNLFQDLDGNAVTSGTGSGTFDLTLVTKNLAYQTRNCYGYAGSASADYQPLSLGSGATQLNVTGNLTEADPRFTDPVHYNFSLQTGSPAVGAANPVYAPLVDITGAARSATTPSLGAYEGASTGGGGGTTPVTTLGKTTVGASSDTAIAADKKTASQTETLTAPLTVNEIVWYLAGGTSAQTARAAIYADNAGSPGALLTPSVGGSSTYSSAAYSSATYSGSLVSNDVTVAAGQPAGWVSFPVASTQLAAGSKYWLALHTGATSGQITARYDTGTGATASDSYSDGISDPFGTFTATTRVYSAYADQTGSQPGQTTVGKTTVGTNQIQGLTADWKAASRSPLSNQLTVNRIRWYIQGGAASQTVRALLYADTSFGEPGALIAASADKTIPAGQPAGWVDFLIPETTLTAAAYWIGLAYGQTSGSLTIFYDLDGGAERYNADTFADGSSDPFGPATGPTATLSAYADYTASTPSTPTDAPTVVAAAANANRVLVLFSESLDPAFVPAASAFSFFRGGVAETPTAVSLADAELILTLATSLSSSASLTLVYTRPSSQPLTSIRGVIAQSFSTGVANHAGRDTSIARTTAVSRTVNPSGRPIGGSGGGI